MKTSLALLLLAAFCLATPVLSFGISGEGVYKATREYQERLRSADPNALFTAYNHLHSQLQSFRPRTQSLASCLSAYVNVTVAQQSCPAGLFGNAGINIFANYTQQQLTDYCASPCIARVEATLRILVTECSLADLNANVPGGDVTAFIDLLLAAMKVPCVKVSNNFCLPIFQSALNTLQGHQGDFTVQDLNTICVPCVPVMIRVLAVLNERLNPSSGGNNDLPGGPFSFLFVLCVKDGGEFCIPKFTSVTRDLDARNDTDGLVPSPLIERVCDRCVARVMARLYVVTGRNDFGNFLLQFRFMCVRNPQGRVCMGLVYDDWDTSRTACASIATQCTPACAAVVSHLLSTAGCCATWLMDAAAQDGQMTSAQLQTLLLTSCQVSGSFPARCPPRNATFSFILANLKYQYFLANRAAVQDKIAEDVAAEAGVDPANVAVASASATGDAGSSVTVSIATSSQTEANEVQATLATSQASGNLYFSSVSSLPAESRVNLLEPAGDEVVPSSQSAGYFLQPSALVMLVLALLAVALL